LQIEFLSPIKHGFTVGKNPNIATFNPLGASKFIRPHAKTVGIVHTPAGLRLATRLKPSDVDLIEIRVDSLSFHLKELDRLLPQIACPLIITVRHPSEGGAHGLLTAERRELYSHFMPFATLMDVELRSLTALKSTIEEAKKRRVGLIVSDHSFQTTPSLAKLLLKQKRAFSSGATIFKLATLTSTSSQLSVLLALLQKPETRQRAVMGMGKFGPVSRLLLAQAGSFLNYGYLDTPNASGQWEARELKKLIHRLGE